MSVIPPPPQPPAPILIPDALGRIWTNPAHIAAGYNLAVFGPIPKPNSTLIGSHTTPQGNTVTVSYLAQGPSGNPELQVTLPHGAVVTVVDEATAAAYIAVS